MQQTLKSHTLALLGMHDECSWEKSWKQGTLTDLEVMAMFTKDAERIIDSYLKSIGQEGCKAVLNKTTGFFFELYLALSGVISVDELTEGFPELLQVKRADIRLREGSASVLRPNAPCIVFLHGIGMNSGSLREKLLPLLVKAKFRAIFIEGSHPIGMHGGKTYVQRSAEQQVEAPMAMLHTVAKQIKEVAAKERITVHGLYGFSQGAIIASLLAAGWASDLLPKLQEDPIHFIIAQCGSELHWRTSVPQCFQCMPISSPAFVSFGKKDGTPFGKKEERLAFSGWFDKKVATRVDHSGAHEPLPSNVRKLNRHVKSLLTFVKKRAKAGLQVQLEALEA